MYPGGKRIDYVSEPDFHPPEKNAVMPALRLMNEDGSLRPGVTLPELDKETTLKAYRTMLRLQAMDTVFNDAQRQGRISFYMTNSGEEATHLGTALAMKPDDEVFAQYREAGVLMWRGFTIQQFADQVCCCRRNCYGRFPPPHTHVCAHARTPVRLLFSRVPPVW